jgi:hypothetical protein
MEFDPHHRAHFLIDEMLVAQIPEEDRSWLAGHTRDCAACRSYEEVSARIVSGLHSLSFETDPETRRRVHQTIARQGTPARMPLWLLAAAALFLLVSIPVLYRAREARRERADALLLEGVDRRLSRTVPAAMEPLTGSMQ